MTTDLAIPTAHRGDILTGNPLMDALALEDPDARAMAVTALLMRTQTVNTIGGARAYAIDIVGDTEAEFIDNVRGELCNERELLAFYRDSGMLDALPEPARALLLTDGEE
jgi:hypothetical protein